MAAQLEKLIFFTFEGLVSLVELHFAQILQTYHRLG